VVEIVVGSLLGNNQQTRQLSLLAFPSEGRICRCFRIESECRAEAHDVVFDEVLSKELAWAGDTTFLPVLCGLRLSVLLKMHA
jgi:hypothetical protein